MNARRWLPAFGLLGLLQACDQHGAAEPEAQLHVELASPVSEFRMGETIPLTLSFSSRIPDRYRLVEAHYDRSGRMGYERFQVVPADGALDPLAHRRPGMGGGLTNLSFLKREPWTIQLNLNEWVRFSKPGSYTLSVTSGRVEVADALQAGGSSPIPLRSNDVTLKIVATDAVWRGKVYRNAAGVLDATPSEKHSQSEKAKEARRKALQTLRFLGTNQATRELAKHLRGEDPGGLDFEVYLGLISTAEPRVARAALEEALADPDYPIAPIFLSTLDEVDESIAPENNDRQRRGRNLDSLLQALPRKRGPAFLVSLDTVVKQAWSSKTLPPEILSHLSAELVANFARLPQGKQSELLRNHWDEIQSPALLPILQTCFATSPDNLAGIALRRWYELDPASARPVIVQEISRSEPRFGARELRILPEATLPELDRTLAEHFHSDHGKSLQKLASLIERYASPAILPQVLEKLDPHLGKWACAIQNPILAYVLRVSPESARPRIERGLAARGEHFSACNQSLLLKLAVNYCDPILEEIAIRALDDADVAVAANAAQMLQRFGSPSAKPALWQHFETWSKQWTGQEAELARATFEPASPNLKQLQLGRALSEAVARGQQWLTDQNELQRLAEVSKVQAIERQLQGYVKRWDGGPLRVRASSYPSGFSGDVGQYNFRSEEQLKEKLRQFPLGSEFVLEKGGGDSAANERLREEIRAFLEGSGMLVNEDRG